MAGFWDIDQHEDLHNGVRAYDVHKKPVNCLSFDFFNPTRLLSTSYDGFVRRLDLKTNIFDEVLLLYSKCFIDTIQGVAQYRL